MLTGGPFLAGSPFIPNAPPCLPEWNAAVTAAPLPFRPWGAPVPFIAARPTAVAAVAVAVAPDASALHPQTPPPPSPPPTRYMQARVGHGVAPAPAALGSPTWPAPRPSMVGLGTGAVVFRSLVSAKSQPPAQEAEEFPARGGVADVAENSSPDEAVVGDFAGELRQGALIAIGGVLCQVTKPLGMGSFGVVWAGIGEGRGDVAIKEIMCRSEVELARAEYEAELLQSLTDQGACRLPLFVASQTACFDDGLFSLRVVMSRLHGDPLDKFLQDQALSPRASHVPVERQVCDAFRFARCLVVQLAPTVASIAKIAYHRDVNAHNILVAASIPGEAEPQFGLVDFGLAVDAVRWMDASPTNTGGASEWEFQDVGGDCRYWPTSAWRQFEVGCHELAGSSDLCLEYQTHLDLQGLGITAAQVLAEMLPRITMGPAASAVASDGLWKVQVDSGVWEGLQAYLTAWDDYWQYATHYWSCLLQTFRTGGDWNALKNAFIEIGVHALISDSLYRLRLAISQLEEACRQGGPQPWSSDALSVLPALLVLISAGERRSRQTEWRDVLEALAEPCGPALRPSGDDLMPPGTSTAEGALDRHSAVGVDSSTLDRAPVGLDAAAKVEAEVWADVQLPVLRRRLDNFASELEALAQDMARWQDIDRAGCRLHEAAQVHEALWSPQPCCA